MEQKNLLKEECLTCISEISERAEGMFAETQEKMTTEFKNTMAHFRDEISQALIEIVKEKDLLKSEIKDDQKKSDGIIKFTMSMVMVLVVGCVGAVSFQAGQIAGKADERELKEELKKFVTVPMLSDIIVLRDAYYRDQFVLSSEATTDSTNYHMILKLLLGQNQRGGDKWYKDMKPYKDK